MAYVFTHRPAVLCALLFVTQLHVPAAAVAVTTAATAATVAAPCTTNADCEWLGTCNSSSGACSCKRGFTGPSCGEFNFLPASADNTHTPLWPKSIERSAHVSSAWGFTTQYDGSDQLYHAFVTVACNSSGVLGSGGGDSWIAHLASPTPDGGYQLVNMVVPQTTFGPHVARAPDGSFVFVFRVNAIPGPRVAPLCGGNGSDPLPSTFEDGAYIPSSKLAPGDPEIGTSIYVAWSTRMAGPWSVAQLNITGAGGVHKSNPSLTFLPSGEAVLGYRYTGAKVPGGKSGEMNAVATAADFRGPYACIVNLTNGAFGDEDPFVWVDAVDASVHMAWHNHDFGFHASSPPGNIRTWNMSPVGAHAFTLNVTLSNGTAMHLLRRERPEIRFNADGSPAMLYTGVQAADKSAFVLGQGFAV